MPLIELRYILNINQTLFIPNLDSTSEGSLVALMESIVVDFYSMSDMITRVAVPVQPQQTDAEAEKKTPTYESKRLNCFFFNRFNFDLCFCLLKALLEDEKTVDKLRKEIMRNVSDVIKKTNEYISKYEIYKKVWSIDKKNYLEYFLKYGRTLSIDDVESIDAGTFAEKEIKPNLDNFRNEVGGL